jgi:D-glycero-D-manno-heptose 1,7-bisphosphate phosphatase
VKQRAIFLDRDGTLNVDAGFTYRIQHLKLMDGVVPGLLRMQDLGFKLLITTNQSGVARGLFSEADMHAFNRALVADLAAGGIAIDGVYCCPFHPTAGMGAYRVDSPLRKPRPGMMLQAAGEHAIDLDGSFAIGDKSSDVIAGQAAGCRTILLRTANGGHTELAAAQRPDALANDLVEAAEFVERCLRGTADFLPIGRGAHATLAASRETQARKRA